MKYDFAAIEKKWQKRWEDPWRIQDQCKHRMPAFFRSSYT